MSSTREKSEAEYLRARMGDLYINEEDSAPPPSSPSTAEASAATTEEPPSSNLPETTDAISAAEALEAKVSGNACYKSGDYTSAVDLYTRAASSKHSTDEERAIALANRAAALLKMERFRETVDDTCAALELKPGYVKALKRRKEARIRLEEFRKAVEDAKELGEQGEVIRLTRMAEEKEKKETDEAMKGLKDLGNSLLSNFGMSLDDFNVDKDPSTGNYSINMKR